MRTLVVMGLLIFASFSHGMTPSDSLPAHVPAAHVPAVQIELEEKVSTEKLLLVEGGTGEWDAICPLLRPEFKKIMEQEYSTQELAAACKALQTNTKKKDDYLALMRYVKLNGEAQRPWSSVDEKFEKALMDELTKVEMLERYHAIGDIGDYKEGCLYISRQWLAGINSALTVGGILIGVLLASAWHHRHCH